MGCPIATVILHRLRPSGCEDRGAIAVLTAAVATLLLVVAALSVDVGNAWAVRGQLQVEADNAAVFAADALPIQTSGASAGSTQLAVAKRVAYSVACFDTDPSPAVRSIRGQRESNPDIPACPPAVGTADPAASPTLDLYATKLLAQGLVTFPTSTSVSVTTPTSTVDFGFGPVADARHVDETKSSSAKIYSPGQSAPVAMSLQCVLTAAGQVPDGVGDLASGAVPLSYIAPGPLTPAAGQEPPESVTLAAMPDGQASTMSLGISPGGAVQGGAALLPTVRFSGAALAGSGLVRAVFYRGSGPAVPSGSVTYTALTGVGTSLGLSIPPAVRDTVGVWFVQLEWQQGSLLGNAPIRTTSKSSHLTYTVSPPAGTTSLTACANLSDNPRRDTNNAVVGGETLKRNIKSGMDHSLTAYDGLVTLSPPASVTPASIVGLVSGSEQLTNCTGSPMAVLDDDASRVSPRANCVHIATDGSRQGEFTQGFLGDPRGTFQGRLDCNVDSTHCPHGSFTISGFTGRQFNDDKFTDFVNPGSVLSSSLFFSLSTYLTDDIPVVTPPSTALRDGIYSSPRFLWAAVVSRTVGPTKCQDCPVLTFRPIFLTQSLNSSLLPGVPVVDSFTTQLAAAAGSLYSALVGSLFPFLSPAATATDHGVIVAGQDLKALRFQTIEPTALPPVPLDYNGPVSDYLGAGPKVIRLIK